MFKEAIRRVLYFLTLSGFADAEIVCTSGTVKYRFYNWLYGDPAPLFDTQLPD